MNISFSVDIPKMRHFTFLTVILFCSNSLLGQVNAVATVAENRSGEKTISINWSEKEALAWKNENHDGLEIMALKTDLHSASLPVSGDIKTFYSISLQRKT